MLHKTAQVESWGNLEDFFFHFSRCRENSAALPIAERKGMKECTRCTLTPTYWRGLQRNSVQQSGQSFKVLQRLTDSLLSQGWAVQAALAWLVSQVMRRSWQAESSHSRCSLTLPNPPPQANAQMQMSAQATGRGDKTHQVTLPFRTVNTLPCHTCVIPSHQMIRVIGCDRQHLCGPQKSGFGSGRSRRSANADHGRNHAFFNKDRPTKMELGE